MNTNGIETNNISIGVKIEHNSSQENLPTREQLPSAREQPMLPSIAEAKKGADAFKKVADLLKPPLRKKFTEDSDLKRCFVGTTPELGARSGNLINNLSNSERAELKKALSGTPNIILIENNEISVEVPPENAGLYEPDNGKYSLLNVVGAERIVSTNRDLFPPETSNNTRDWLINNISTWSSDDLMLGVLSGYPRESVIRFSQLPEIYQRLHATTLTTTEIEEIRSLRSTNIDPKKITKLLLEKTGNVLSADEIYTLTHEGTADSKALNGFIYFHTPEEIAYIKAADDIYEQSEIDQPKRRSRFFPSVSRMIRRFKKTV